MEHTLFPQHLNDESWLRIRVLLAFQKALLGEVPSSLRAVTVSWDQSQIGGIFYYEGLVSEAERERVEEIETEIIAMFPEHQVRLNTVGVSSGSEVEPLMEWVFFRSE